MRKKIKMQWADRIWMERYEIEEMRRPQAERRAASGKTK